MIGAGTVAVVADDLIWASRILEAVRRSGAAAIRLGTDADLVVALEAAAAAEPPEASAGLAGVIVDLFGHRYDGIAAVERVAAARLPVIAVAQHDDTATRKRALAAGAKRVYSYNKFFTDGPTIVAAWLGTSGGSS